METFAAISGSLAHHEAFVVLAERLAGGRSPATPAGRVTGLLVLRAATHNVAEAIAHADPFHLAGFRHHHVHAWSIRFVQPEIGAAIAASLERKP